MYIAQLGKGTQGLIPSPTPSLVGHRLSGVKQQTSETFIATARLPQYVNLIRTVKTSRHPNMAAVPSLDFGGRNSKFCNLPKQAFA